MAETEAGRQRKAGNIGHETEWLGLFKSSDVAKSAMTKEERVLGDPVLPLLPWNIPQSIPLEYGVKHQLAALASTYCGSIALGEDTA